MSNTQEVSSVHRYPLGGHVYLTARAVDRLMKKFGIMTGLNSPWTVIAQTFSGVTPSYTIRNEKGAKYEGVKEDSLRCSGVWIILRARVIRSFLRNQLTIKGAAEILANETSWTPLYELDQLAKNGENVSAVTLSSIMELDGVALVIVRPMRVTWVQIPAGHRDVVMNDTCLCAVRNFGRTRFGQAEGWRLRDLLRFLFNLGITSFVQHSSPSEVMAFTALSIARKMKLIGITVIVSAISVFAPLGRLVELLDVTFAAVEHSQDRVNKIFLVFPQVSVRSVLAIASLL
ncbi:hypothetical protein CPB84DRAFT_1912998 [Gymnopilus junonius]|uniref:Uncharacterized protein n=1 Tax=Gymnopilus junonius TaxID=109634 RepID=A0A9P5NZ76_GYMJU|nr:hypothetical protein CPB84DRAFT_1912998 [Gymnopilus junonius]